MATENAFMVVPLETGDAVAKAPPQSGAGQGSCPGKSRPARLSGGWRVQQVVQQSRKAEPGGSELAAQGLSGARDVGVVEDHDLAGFVPGPEFVRDFPGCLARLERPVTDGSSG
jgi:hypothetical protein